MAGPTLEVMPSASPTVTDEVTKVVLDFLQLLQAGDVDGAAELLDPDIEYTNVSLPTIRGRERVRQALSTALGRPRAGFEVVVHHVAADGDVVLTDRTDVLVYGKVRVSFWVYGRFVVRDGLITVWRDSFDWLNITAATVRGLASALFARAGRPS